jgi:hypothetical protein
VFLIRFQLRKLFGFRKLLRNHSGLRKLLRNRPVIRKLLRNRSGIRNLLRNRPGIPDIFRNKGGCFSDFFRPEKCLRNDKNASTSCETVSLRRRHHCLSVKDRLQSNIWFLAARTLIQNLRNLPYQHLSRFVVQECQSKIKACILICLLKYQSLRSMESAIFWAKLPIIVRKHIRINHLSDGDSKLKFRFHSANDLSLVFTGLQFPHSFTSPVGRKFSGEEVFLSGIFRLAYPNRLDDDCWRRRFGFDYQTTSQACALFFGFMVSNWAYFLFDMSTGSHTFQDSIKQFVTSALN